MLKKKLSKFKRQLERKVVHASWDSLEAAIGDRPPLVPPRSINQNTHYYPDRKEYIRHFVESGNEIKNMLMEYGGLQPSDRVLDIGCGIGRVARALTEYLTEGTYHGFDAEPTAMQWCKDAYKNYPSFHFEHVAVKYAGLDVKREAEEVTFPYDGDMFDFAFSISVFTHLKPAGIRQYLREISRTVVKGGTTVNTFFVLDDFALQQMEKGATSHKFKYQGEGFRAKDGNFIENGTAYTPEQIREMHEQAGLQIIEPVRFGSWAGRDNKYIYQDIVIAKHI